MKEKIKLTSMKKMTMIIMCVALLLTLGVTTVSAAGGEALSQFFKIEDGNPSYSVDGGNTWIEGMAEDSNIKYSLDDGKTWHEGLPPGGDEESVMVTIGDGEMPDEQEFSGIIVTSSCSDSEIPDEHEVTSIEVVNEDGIQKYSTDGGKTWSEGVPDGVIVSDDGNSISYTVTTE